MSFIEWDEKTFGLGIPELDTQHKFLFELVNHFFVASKKPPNKRVNSMLFDKLIQYTEFHFQHEEKFLQSIDYPILDNHQLSHINLVERLTEVRSQFEKGEGEISLETLNFLKTWLTVHIQKHDKKYSSFYRELKK